MISFYEYVTSIIKKNKKQKKNQKTKHNKKQKQNKTKTYRSFVKNQVTAGCDKEDIKLLLCVKKK